MAFTTPPAFVRPEGNPGSLREFAGLLTALAEVFDLTTRQADEFEENGSNLYWENDPGNVFWGGVAQENYIDSAVKRMRLLEFAGTTFRDAGNVLVATAEHLATAQSGVDQAQQIASQRASADAVSMSPVPLSFEQEQQVVTTSTTLAAASASEAAAKLRALAAATPGYVAPSAAGGGTIPSLGGTRTTGAEAAITGTGAGSAGASNTGGSAGGGSAGTGSSSAADADNSSGARRADVDTEGAGGSGSTTGGSTGVGGGSSAAGATRGSDDEEPARAVEDLG